jgi:hypothetical protein
LKEEKKKSNDEGGRCGMTAVIMLVVEAVGVVVDAD